LLAARFALSWNAADFDCVESSPTSMARLRKSRKILGRAGQQVSLPASATDFFCLEPGQLFPAPAPIEVELGSGRGDFILERAGQFPQRNFLAVELAGSIFQLLAIRVARSGLGNLRALRADARPVVNLMLPGESVRAFHVYFPDPWPKSRHSKHRLFSPRLVAGLARCLEPGGRIYLATDVDWYFEHIAIMFEGQDFRLAKENVPGAERTNFGRRFATAGKTIHAACFQLRAEPAAMSHSVVQVAVDV
jgi:tRNA (guanine-N7-)-methyltransferase